LEGGRASASVVCDKDDTQIAIIEGYFLEVLFEYYPELSGRFFHYLAHVLSKRLKQRELGLNNSGSPALKESTSSSDLKDSGKKKRSKKHSKKESSKDLKLSKSASETEDSEESKDS
jgi:CRP-like cAMP-binding protein